MVLALPSYGQIPPPGSTQAPGLWRGLQGLWMPILGSTGGTLYDLSSRGNNGTITGSDWGWSTAGGYFALEFNQTGSAGASGDYVTIPDKDGYDGNSRMTIAILVRNHKDTIGATGNETLFEKTGGGDDSYRGLWQSSEDLFTEFNLTGGDSVVDTTDAITDGTKWHLIAVTQDGANHNQYLDAVLQGQTAGTTAVNATAHPLVIGDNSAGASWDGWVGLFGVWNRALTQNEIRQLYIDPLIMVRPRRRVFFVPAAAGGAGRGRMLGGGLMVGGTV